MNVKRIMISAAIMIAATFAGTAQPAHCKKNCEVRIAKELKYRPDGKFKIVQFADTHYIKGDSRSERALQNVIETLDSEKPDFVIFTGDVIFTSPAEPSAREILQPLVERGIPFAIALGNHDSDFDLSRSDIFKVYRSVQGNVNTPDDLGLHGCSNDILTLSDDKGVDRVFYLFDSGNRDNIDGYGSWGYVHSDQIEWYKRASRYFTEKNGGKPIPSIVFQHIPVPEYNQAMRDKGDKARFMRGNLGEEPCSPIFNSGQYVAMREMGDVQAMVAGHDHNNDFVLMWQHFFFIYGRYSGGDTVYNDLYPSGARVFEFTAHDNGFRTWVRVSGGTIEQEMYLFPGMQSLSDKRQQ